MPGVTEPRMRPADELLALALSRPREALSEARELLASPQPAGVAAVAHQAAGIVLRHFGDIDEALAEFRAGLRAARRAGDTALAADLRSSYGVALLLAGRPRAGLTQVGAAAGEVSGEAAGRIQIRRAYCLWLLGRHAEMLEAAQQAVVLLRDGNGVWAGRAMAHRALANLGLGALTRADKDYARAQALFAAAGQQLEYAASLESRATVAFVRGDLPRALELLDEADLAVEALGVFEPDLVVARAQVLLAAGLAREAVAAADRGVMRSERLHASAARRGELLLVAALAARAAGDPRTASARGGQALQLFRRQRRPGWAARAELVVVDSRFASGDAPAGLLPAAVRLARRLGHDPAPLAAQAHLLAGRLALAAGRPERARRELVAAGHGRSRDLRARATACLARAVLAEAEGRPGDMLVACARGLDALEAHLRTLGATELRAQATAQGGELAALALRRAVRTGNARMLLEWSERWRATALAATSVPEKVDPTLAQELAKLRTLARRVRTPDGDARGFAGELEQERRRVEDAVRRRALHAPGSWSRRHPPRPRLGELRTQLGTTELVELAEVDGELHAVLLRAGAPPRTVRVGPIAAADRAVTQARFVLRRQGPRQRSAPLDLGAIGRRLQETLLGPLGEALEAPAVVLVPPGRLHAVPWSLVPALRERSVAVAPSAAAWLRARQARRPPGRVVIVGGPGLLAAPEEVRRLSEQYDGATVLAGGEATCDRVLQAMDGAWLVHVAAHGVFRADSPLFSALELDDGPLTVYDLERLHRAPHRVVLSSCDSALGAPSGADEILGVVSALMALGSAGVVASVVPVDDPGTVPFMLELHRRLPGTDLAEALAAARRSVEADPAARYPAESFIALGA